MTMSLVKDVAALSQNYLEASMKKNGGLLNISFKKIAMDPDIPSLNCTVSG